MPWLVRVRAFCLLGNKACRDGSNDAGGKAILFADSLDDSDGTGGGMDTVPRHSPGCPILPTSSNSK